MAATSEMRRSRKESERPLWGCKDRRGCDQRVKARQPHQLGLIERPPAA